MGLQPGVNNPASGPAIPVTANPVLSPTGFFGQKKIATTGTAVQLQSNVLVNGVIITALSTNAAPIVIGGSGVTRTADGTGNGYVLQPGAGVSFAVTNTNILYINGTIGDGVSFGGS